MLKSEAIKLLGGTHTAAAAAIGNITPQAISAWPEVLPPRIADRVLAALYRQQNPEPTAKRQRKARA